MELFLKLSSVIHIVLLAQVHSDREVVEVKVDTGSSLDLSKTDLTTSYCELRNNECPGKNIAPGHFAATTSQCLALCSRNLQCLSAFYSKEKICNLRGSRCDMSQLKSNPEGVDLYRLRKKETCPAGRPLFIVKAISYSNKFCMWRGKACPGHNLYNKAQNIFPNLECLKKCAKINTCPGVDYYKTAPNCEPKDYACPDAELVDSPGTINYIRLQEGVSQCPSNRVAGESVPATATVQTPLPAPEQVTTTTVQTPVPEPNVSTTVQTPVPEPEELSTTVQTPVPEPEEVSTTVQTPVPEPEVSTTVQIPVPEPEVSTTVQTPVPEPEVSTTVQTPVPEPEVSTTVQTPVPEPEEVSTTIQTPVPEPEEVSTTVQTPVTEPEEVHTTVQPPVPVREPEQSPVPSPATCSFYQELQQLMAKYPDGCAPC